MIRGLARALDDHYWTVRWLGVCGVAFAVMIRLGGIQ